MASAAIDELGRRRIGVTYRVAVTFPWPPAAATGIGSLPYDDRDEATRVVAGELPEFVHVPELPGRGAGAGMIGRTASLLVDMHVDLQPAGWRVIDRESTDERRARSMLRADLDALEIGAYGYEGALKVQSCGPLTLAAGLERTRGDRMLADYGARRELAESLAEGLALHVADVSKRLAGANVVVQIDEPSLPDVLVGAIPTISGYGRLRSVSESEAETLLGLIVTAVDVPVVVHCCAARVPSSLIHNAGASAVSLDVGVVGAEALDELAQAVDAGLAVWPGVVPSVRPSTTPTDTDLAERVQKLWRRLDHNPAAMVERTVITPTCGLAGADVPWARDAYRLVRSTARAFADQAQAEV